MRDPRRFVLDRADLQPREPVEHAGEQHRAERIAHPIIGGRPPRPGQFGHIHRELVGRNPAARRADMQQQRLLQILRHRPQRVIDRVAIRLVGQRRDRNERADEAHFGAAFELLGAGIGIVDIEHCDALKAARMRLAEIGDPVVVDPADLGQQRAVRNAVPEQPLTGLQHGAPDAVLLVFGQHRLGVVGALADILPKPEKIDLRGVFEALPCLHHRTEGADLHSVEHPGIVIPACGRFASFHARRAIAQLWLEAARVHVRRFDDVGIRRDQPVARHLTPPSVATLHPMAGPRNESSDRGPRRRESPVPPAISASQRRARSRATRSFALDRVPCL